MIVNDQDKSKEELINELQELRRTHNSLKVTLDAGLLDTKLTDLALKESEWRYRTLLGNLEAGIVVHAADTSIVLNNQKACELLGLSNDQMRGKVAIDPAWKFINEDMTPIPLDGYPVSRIVSGRQPIKNQVLGICQPGKNEVVWVTVNGFPSLNNNGEITEIVISFIDITERKQAEQANLKLEEEQRFSIYGLNTAQSLARMGSWKWDIKNDKVSWSDEMYHIFGIDKYSYEGLLRNVIKSIIHPDDLHVVLPENAAEFAKKEINEYRIILPDNSIRLIQAKAGQTEFDSEGNPVFFSGIAQDITERRNLEKIREIQYNIATAVVTSENVEQLLEFVRTQLSQMFDTVNFFAALYNAKNNRLKKLHWVDEVDDFEEWDAAKSFSGYVVKTGKTLLLNKQEIAKLGAEQDIPVIGAPAECWLGVPLVVDKKTIGVLVIQSYTNPTAYDDSSAMLFEQVAYDLSVFIEKAKILQDLKIAKAQAIDSDRLKSAFLANMSHEIRTPMNGILGFAELLKTPGLSGEQQQQYIKIIEKSGARMLNIINDIVDISKIEAGLMKADIKESNINEQIEYIFTFFKPEVEAKGMKISFRNSLPAKKAIIKTDREKLYAILTNLVKNAIKYTNNGSIEFGYNLVESVNSPSVQFYVKDTGIGIPHDRQDPIFERFIQADITDKMAQQGAGLGLSITKAYVEMLGGKIWVESRLGMGSTFFFTLPYNADRVMEPVDQQLTPSGKFKNVRKLKILIAEDDEVSEMLIDLTVKTFTKEILKVRTGVEAIEACRNNPGIDLILMDIRMPEMSGYKATQQIREFNKEVVIIAQTAYGLSNDMEKSLEAGCNDYLAKPILKAELLALIHKYFGK